MAISRAKEVILKKVRRALSHPSPLPFPSSEGVQNIFTSTKEESVVTFAEEFTRLQGKFAYCTDKADMLDQLLGLFKNATWEKYYYTESFITDLLSQKVERHTDLASCDVAITGCEYLIARTGSIVLSSARDHGRTASVYAPIHICLAFVNQLKDDIRNALQELKGLNSGDFPSLITFASGPSRTADIEKTLVTGVHGPKEVYCFLIEDEATTKTTI